MAFEMPDSLDGLSVEDLSSLHDEASAAFDEAVDALTDEATEDDIVAAETLRDQRDQVQSELIRAEAALEDRQARLGDLRTKPEPEADEPKAEDDGGEPAAETEPVEEPAEEKEPALVAAGDAPPTAVQRAAEKAPELDIPDDGPAVSLVAAADVPGFVNGEELEGIAAVSKAVLAKTKGLPRTNLATKDGGVRQRYGAALLQKQYDDGLVQTAQSDDYAMVWKAGDESRLPGGSLVAAGGWCAPSETLYDLCQLETLEGILDISEFSVTRGGIRWTQGPDFSDIYEACGFFQTEAEAIAGECKDCCSVDCPPFDEIRLDAIGLCIKSPILTEHAYPELVQRFIEGALVAHAHKVNKYIIDAMVMAAGTPVPLAEQGRLTFTLMPLENLAVGMRYQYRLALDATIELVAPYWLKMLVRQDMEMENGGDRSVSDAEIDAWFSARNMVVQWVYDFQDPVVSDCAIEIPDTVSILMYPAGTWARGSADVINVDAVYDSPNLEANQYTALFVEEGILAVQRCTHTCHYEVPICVSGKGVLEDIDVCLVAPAPTSTGTGTGT